MIAQFKLGLHHGLHTIVHVLNEVFFTAAKTAPVRDVKDAIAGIRVFTMLPANLHAVAVSDALEPLPILHQVRKADVHRSTHGSTEVRRARRNVAKMVVVSEPCDSLDVLGSTGEALENSADVSAWLHRDNAQLVLLVDPDQEGLGIVVEDASTLGPVTVESASLKEAVTLFE